MFYRGFKIKKDNKMRSHGDMDEDKKEIRINVKKHKDKRMNEQVNKKRLANTIKHEKKHVDHPKMIEENVYKNTREEIKGMTDEQIKKLVRKAIK